MPKSSRVRGVDFLMLVPHAVSVFPDKTLLHQHDGCWIDVGNDAAVPPDVFIVSGQVKTDDFKTVHVGFR